METVYCSPIRVPRPPVLPRLRLILVCPPQTPCLILCPIYTITRHCQFHPCDLPKRVRAPLHPTEYQSSLLAPPAELHHLVAHELVDPDRCQILLLPEARRIQGFRAVYHGTIPPCHNHFIVVHSRPGRAILRDLERGVRMMEVSLSGKKRMMVRPRANRVTRLWANGVPCPRILTVSKAPPHHHVPLSPSRRSLRPAAVPELTCRCCRQI